MSKLRPITVFEWKRVEGEVYFEKIEKCQALFHRFGMDFEEREDSVASYSSAIVQFSDGMLGNIPVELIRFDDATEEE